MARNGHRTPRRPRIVVGHAAASPEEAAAIAGAIEQFLRDTTPQPAPPPRISAWLRTALFENVGLDASASGPWGDPEPWGRVPR